MTSSLGYMLRDGEGRLHIIDPGWDSEINWLTWADAFFSIGATIGHLSSITVTHLHRDHLGLVARLREASGAEVAIHSIEQVALDDRRQDTARTSAQLERWGVPAGCRTALIAATASSRWLLPAWSADVLLSDGDILPIPGRTLQVVWTPGHTSGHICIRDSAESLLFTGDHLLPDTNSGLGLGGETTSNPLEDYLESLRCVSGFDRHLACPGHGRPFRNLSARCDAIADHHRRRSEEVATALHSSPDRTIWQIAENLTWSVEWQKLPPRHVRSALAQTEMHRDYVRSPGEHRPKWLNGMNRS